MKKVVYPSKYIKAYQDDYRYEWVKLNDEPIEIEYVEDEHDEEYDFQPSFWWNNQRYHLNDFIRAKIIHGFRQNFLISSMLMKQKNTIIHYLLNL